jgi:hypothetical protein
VPVAALGVLFFPSDFASSHTSTRTVARDGRSSMAISTPEWDDTTVHHGENSNCWRREARTVAPLLSLH